MLFAIIIAIAIANIKTMALILEELCSAGTGAAPLKLDRNRRGWCAIDQAPRPSLRRILK